MSKQKTYKTNLGKTVMSKIKSGQAKMRPHYYYVLVSVLGIIFVALAGFAISYFMSVVTLWLRIQAASGPAYGAKRNLSLLVQNFPWWALVLGLISFVAAIFVVRRLGHLYKVRLAYLVPIAVAVAILLGVIFSYSSLPNFKGHGPGVVGGHYRHGQKMK